jgi:alpha-L-fucosidase
MNKIKLASALHRRVFAACFGTVLAAGLSVGCGSTSSPNEETNGGSPGAGAPAQAGSLGSAGSPVTANGGASTAAGGAGSSGGPASGGSGVIAGGADAGGASTQGGSSAGGTVGAGGASGGSAGTAGAAAGSGGSGGSIVNLTCPAGNAICTAKTYNDITAAHSVPSWVKTAKLGIGMHFMVATVPAYHNEWFFQHEYCNKAFADWTTANFPAKSPLSGGPWGYKDFIPLFTVDKWSQTPGAHAATNAASWAALFKASGATFVNATAEHHDRFAMWDSSEPVSMGSAGTWNAMKMGPKRDIVGELAVAVKAQGMKFGVNNHIMYGYSFAYCGPNGTTPGSVGPKTPASVSDLYDPAYALFYGPPNPGCGALAADASCSPDQAFCDDWLYRSEELVDKYQLDNEWFDWDGATQPNTPCYNNKLKFVLHYYQNAAAWGKDVQVMSKGGVFPNMNNNANGANVAMQDFQSTIPTTGPASPWMSDETISSNGSWSYVEPMTYKSAASVISELDTINGRGGVLLLNISPMKDGTIPAEQVAILNAVGKHLGAPGNF